MKSMGGELLAVWTRFYREPLRHNSFVGEKPNRACKGCPAENLRCSGVPWQPDSIESTQLACLCTH